MLASLLVFVVDNRIVDVVFVQFLFHVVVVIVAVAVVVVVINFSLVLILL